MCVRACSLDWHAITHFALTHIYAVQKSRQLTHKDGRLAFTERRRVTVRLSITVHCAPISDRNVEVTLLARFGIELLSSLTNYVKIQISWQVIFVL
jgi:hypothetical protein